MMDGQQSIATQYQNTEALHSWYTHIPEQTNFIYIYDHEIDFKSTFIEEIPPEHIYGKREKIYRFSDASRLRLLRFLASLPFNDLGRKYFLTLTYHNIYPHNSRVAKADLHLFLIRLQRKYPGVRYIWKMEFQDRGAPHFHIILFVSKKIKIKNMYRFKKNMYDLWLPSLHCGCRYCQKHAVLLKELKGFRRVSYYMSKYLAKVDYSEKIDETGRFWGRSDSLLPRVRHKIACDLETAEKLREFILKRLLQKGSSSAYYAEKIRYKYNFFVFLSDEDLKEIEIFINKELRPPPSAPQTQKNKKLA